MKSFTGVWIFLLVSVELLYHRYVAAAFLQNQLPLEVVLTTPSNILDKETGSITVAEQMAFQAVFSRPVIALGSDFGQAKLPQTLVPFTVNCPVPGRFRWVTTNIARWDPSIEWPTDLDCTFEWNTALKSFDGAPLVLNSPKSVRLTSRPLKVEVASIDSAAANAATDKQWNAYRGMSDDKFPEVPPDANITLTFNYPVLLSALQSALAVVPCCGSNAGASQTVKVYPCGPPYVVVDPFATPAQQALQQQNSTCAVVRMWPGLPPSGVAILRLQKGVRYNTVSGVTKNDTDVYLWGLRRFRIPLRDNFQQLANSTEQFNYLENGITFRRLTLWLPHGLAAGVTADQLKAQMSLCQYADPYEWSSPCNSIPFTLEKVNKGQLLMTVPSFMPRQHYRVQVAGNPAIKDAFGLPLEASKAYFFTTEPAQGLAYAQLASGAQVMLLEPEADEKPLQWPVLYQGSPRYDSDPLGVSVWPISDNKLVSTFQVVQGDDKPEQVKALLGAPAEKFTRTYSTLTASKVMALSGKPGVQLVGCPTNSSYDGLSNTVMVVQSDLQYAAISVGSRITHFVTLTTPQATALAQAKVSIFLIPYGEKPILGPVCTTAADGTCTVDLKALLTGRWGTLTATVEAAGHGPLVIWSISQPSLYEDETLQYPFVGALVLDRVIVNPGDQLHVTGFVQERNGVSERLALPSALTSVNVAVMPDFKPSDSGEPLIIRTPLNATYGSFHMIIPVPPEAKPGDYSIALRAPKTREAPADGGKIEEADITSVSFQVGNPRLPTAVLNVTVPDWSPPGSTVKVLIKASSYLGADVAGASIDIAWSVPLASGKINVTTDAKGLAEAAIPLGQLPPQNATVLGDALSITVQWVGPTRELITQSVSVRLANGPVRVELTRSPSTDVPGVPFIMSAATWLNDKVATQLEGVTVEVFLTPNSSNALENCTAAAAELVKAQRCLVVSGKPFDRPCVITLPCAADLKLVACPVSYSNGTKITGRDGKPACSETPIGRNTTAWEESPWSFLPSLGLLKDRQNYTVGSTAVVSWSNSYWRPASGMLVWGNARLQKQKAIPTVPVGPNSVSFTVGEECLGGCAVQLVLSLPKPSGDNTVKKIREIISPLQLGLPTSKLFNPLAPATVSAFVQLNVWEDNRLNVTVQVVPAAAAGAAMPKGLFKSSAELPGGKLVPVLAPKSSADIEVKVTDALSGQPAVDAEVTVVVVDEAILALMPYPLPDLGADLVAYPGLAYFVKEINEYRTSRAAINTTFSTMERRLKLDPWLPLVTTVSPSTYAQYGAWGTRTTYPVASVVDYPDSLYLRGFTNPLTATPFYTWGLAQRYPAGSKGAGDAAAALRLSSEFKTVPLFTIIQTKTDGSASVRFKAPPNLSTFTVRAYAVTKGSTDRPSKYGANETQVIVRQPLSLTASVPQSVRVTDDFEAGVLVSAPDAAGPIQVEITATIVAANQTSSDTGSAETNATSAASPASSGSSSKPMTSTAAAVSAEKAAPVVTATASGTKDTGRKLLAGEDEQTPDGSLVLVPSDPMTSTITLTPTQQQIEVRFRFKAAAIGASGLRFIARIATPNDASGWMVADATQEDVSVLGQQGPVFVATSFALQARSNVTGRQEGLALPAAAPGSGTVQLLAGVGYLPTVKVSYNAVIQQQQKAAASYDDPASFIPSGPDALNAALLPAFLAQYSSSTAAMLASAAAAGNKTTAAAAAGGSKPGSSLVTVSELSTSAAAAKAVATKLTKPASGLMYYVVKSPSDYIPTPSVVLNAWAVWLTDQAQQGLANTNTLQGLEYSEAVKGAYSTWKNVTASQLVKNAQQARDPPTNEPWIVSESLRMYMNFEELCWARLALGSDWAPTGVSAAVAGDLSLSRQVLAATTPKNMSVGCQARTGLTLMQVIKANGKSSSGMTVAQAKSAIDKLTKMMLGSLRVSGRTAFIATEAGGSSAASPEDQAMALLFLVQQELPAIKEVLPKLALYVAGGKAGISSAAAATSVSIGGTAPGTVAAALSTYDSKQGSTSPDAALTVTAVSGDAAPAGSSATASSSTTTHQQQQLLSAKFTPSTAGALANSTTPWSALPPNPRLTFQVQGTAGEVSVAAGLDFTPAELLPFPTYRGLWVERVVQTETGSGNLGTAALADVVTITVQLTSPDPISGVVVEVLMPGGLEPVDPAVYTDLDAQTQCNFGSDGGLSYFSRWWCPDQATLRSVVTFTFDYLGAGTVNIKFKAIAATPGVFVLPPVKAYAVQQPELMGMSAAGSFTVCPNRKGANAAAATAGVAKTPGAASFSQCSQAQMQAPLPAAKSCPGNCNANGVCNILSGSCLCNSGFSGPSCNIFSSS